MIRSRVSITRMLIVVLIAALDCGLVRLFLSTSTGLEGIPAFGLAMSAAVVGWLVGRGRLRRFSAGFVRAGLLGAAVLIGVRLSFPRAASWWADGVAEFTIQRAARSPWFWASKPVRSYGLVDGMVVARPVVFAVVPSVALLFITDVLICLPVLIASLIGGLMALIFPRPEPSNPAPHPTQT